MVGHDIETVCRFLSKGKWTVAKQYTTSLYLYYVSWRSWQTTAIRQLNTLDSVISSMTSCRVICLVNKMIMNLVAGFIISTLVCRTVYTVYAVYFISVPGFTMGYSCAHSIIWSYYGETMSHGCIWNNVVI